MKKVRFTASIALTIMLAVLVGCSSKKDKTEKVPPQQVGPAIPSITGLAPPNAVVAASPQDEAEANTLKEKVVALVKSGDFAAIYKGASDGFRAVGPEQQFVGLWQQQLQQTGAFKEAKEISHTVRPTDGFLVYIYQVQYEKIKKELRLTFGRSKKGKMELTGINHREIK